MVSIHFRIPTGEVRTVDGVDGESVMRVAVGADIPGIIGECGGDLSCATCHVHVAPDWYDRLAPALGDEEDLLEAVDDRSPYSRLSCQIRLRTELEGIEVTVPAD